MWLIICCHTASVWKSKSSIWAGALWRPTSPHCFFRCYTKFVFVLQHCDSYAFFPLVLPVFFFPIASPTTVTCRFFKLIFFFFFYWITQSLLTMKTFSFSTHFHEKQLNCTYKWWNHTWHMDFFLNAIKKNKQTNQRWKNSQQSNFLVQLNIKTKNLGLKFKCNPRYPSHTPTPQKTFYFFH